MTKFGSVLPHTALELSSRKPGRRCDRLSSNASSRLPLSGWASTIRTLRRSRRLAIWAEGEGLSLDPEVIFDPDTVERFVVEVGLFDDLPGPPIEQFFVG